MASSSQRHLASTLAADIVTPALHHMTALEASPMEFVSIAREVGAPSVCFFVHSPRPDFRFPVVAEGESRELKRVLDGEGITVAGLDFFWVTLEGNAERYRRAIELGAALGGKRIVVLVPDNNRSRALEGFAKLCGLAAEYDLAVGLEFMRFTPTCDSLAKAATFVVDSGAPNAGIGIDILHLTRTGGTPADIARIDPKIVSHAQLCDGAQSVPEDRLLFEATEERMIPGKGTFPLVEFLAALPCETPLDVEVPLKSLYERGIQARERARMVLEGANRAIAAANRLR